MVEKRVGDVGILLVLVLVLVLVTIVSELTTTTIQYYSLDHRR